MEIFKLFGSIFVDSDEADRSISKIDKKAEGFGKKLGNGIKTAAKWGTAIAVGAGTAAVGIGMLATPLVKSAANAQAMQAQFEQVFDGVGKNATANLEKIAKETGMLPNRLKGSFTGIAAFAKTTGMETADALALTERATLAAADSAAFYDKSIEEVSESIQSYLKGNYENDAALGISSTETTRNAKANELYGKSFNDLSESQKQLTLLQMVEDGNKLSGALGQAARESDSFENQLGNLKQAWEDVKAKFGEPILEPAVAMIQKLAEWLTNVNVQPLIDGFQAFVDFIDTNVISKFGNLLPFIMSIIDEIKSIFFTYVEYIKGLFTGEGNIGESFTRIFEAIKSVAVPILQDAISFVKGILDNLKQFWAENGEQITQAIKNAFGFIASVIEFIMPVVRFIIEDAWNAIKNVFSGALNIIMGLVKIFSGLFTGDWSKMWEGIKQLFSGAVEAVWGLLQLGFLGKIFKVIKAFGGKAIDVVVDMAGKFRGKFDEIVSAATSKFNAVRDAIMNPINKAKDAFKNAIETIKGLFNFQFKWPKLKMPSFSISGSMNPIKWLEEGVPKLKVNWNALGGIFTEPTIFNTRAGLQGVGEAGAEAILPLTHNVFSSIGKAIAQTMPTQSSHNFDEMISLLKIIANKNTDIYMSTQKVGEVMDNEQAQRTNLYGRRVAY